MLPPPSASISLLPLIGAPLDQTQNDFYVSQLATVVWWLLETAGSAGKSSSSAVARRSVVIGLALARSSRCGEEEDDDTMRESSVNDREGFAQIVSMIAEWPGL
jgi:proteasome assembly chaperone 3